MELEDISDILALQLAAKTFVRKAMYRAIEATFSFEAHAVPAFIVD